MTEPKPFLGGMAWGHVIALLGMLSAGFIAWGSTQTKLDANAVEIAKIQERLTGDEARLRRLEAEGARTDERYLHILDSLERLDQRQERFERFLSDK